MSDQKRKRANSEETDQLTERAKVKVARLHTMASKDSPPQSLSVKGPHQFDKDFPQFREPREVGSFSQDSNRQYHPDKRQLKYVVHYPNKSVNFNLRKGFKEMIKKDESKLEYIDDLLRWVISEPRAFVSKESGHQIKLSSLSTDFVCWRGLLTKLLCSPYENRDGWMIAVILYRGTYFLCDFETEEKKKQLAKVTERQEEMCYWGWKFEQYVTSDKEGGKPDTSRPVNNNEGFCSVVRSRLNKNSLVYGGEVDGIDNTINNSNKYVEYKTTRQIETRNQDINFRRFKLIKWWAQSYLVGISKIVCGYRDDQGIVHSLDEFKTQKIPDEAKDLYNPWKPNVCFNFLDQFLNFVKSAINTDNPKIVHILEWSPGHDVVCQRTENEKYQFLPDWFINWEGWDA
ncbi:decapping and exoribonuclease protein isoform X1 [Patella vulgata]|uniref:decapping and exoribonuclease protein isoform X1 n=1 Tax=Patella vulgata TaxID=6465 RepID=UPI0024A9586F|nr:decapping and exoribonuclease protein isoform X1 [Patella vulgata]